MLGKIIEKRHIRRCRPSFIAGCIIWLAAFGPANLDAYPGFGKKMNPNLSQSCSSCHVMFPKLKLYGRTIREIGYEVPVYEGDYGVVRRVYHQIPAALRGKVEIAGDGAENEVTVKELQVLSGGNVWNNRVSWWFHKHVVEDNELVKLFQGVPHESWGQFNASDALHVRIGMFELPLWFSPSKTKVSEVEYLYYGATTNEENAGALFAPQFGIQVNGHIGSPADDIWDEGAQDDYSTGYNYAVSITNGHPSFQGGLNTVFARVTRKDPRYSAGGFVLGGWDEMTGSYYRIGTDADVYIRGDNITLYGSAAYGKDVDRDFVGGFLGYQALFRGKFLISPRFDLVQFMGEEPHEEDHHHDHEAGHDESGGGHGHGLILTDSASSMSITVCYLFFENVRLGFDYRHGFSGVESRSTLQLQFAF